MISLEKYMYRAPSCYKSHYVDNNKVCNIILQLATQCGPYKAQVTQYIRESGKNIRIKLPRIFPDVLSEYSACDYLFREILNEEVAKVNQFSTMKYEEIYSMIKMYFQKSEYRSRIPAEIGQGRKEREKNDEREF